MYSTKYVVLVRLAVSIVFIVVVFLVPGTRRVGWVVSLTRCKYRYLILISKGFTEIFIIFIFAGQIRLFGANS